MQITVPESPREKLASRLLLLDPELSCCFSHPRAGTGRDGQKRKLGGGCSSSSSIPCLSPLVSRAASAQLSGMCCHCQGVEKDVFRCLGSVFPSNSCYPSVASKRVGKIQMVWARMIYRNSVTGYLHQIERVKEGFSRFSEKVKTAVETAKYIGRIMWTHITLEVYSIHWRSCWLAFIIMERNSYFLSTILLQRYVPKVVTWITFHRCLFPVICIMWTRNHFHIYTFKSKIMSFFIDEKSWDFEYDLD